MKTRFLNRILFGIILILLGYIFFYTPKNKKELCLDYSNSNLTTLKTGVVANMITNYKGNQLDVMNRNMRNTETENILFAIDTLEKFIYQVKNEVRKHSSNSSNEKLGLRAHFGAYPVNTLFKTPANIVNLGSLPSNYGRRMTLVFTATRVNNKGKIIDFDPSNSATYEDGLTFLNNKDKISPSTSLYNTSILSFMPTNNSTSSSSDVMARNHGTIHP